MFSADWTTHHRPVVESGMKARVQIERPGTAGEWNPETGDYDGGTAEVLYLGKALLERIARPTRRDFVFDAADNQMMRAELPMDENEADSVDLRWQSNDILTVLENEANPMMVGEKLYLRGWAGSSHDWLHILHFSFNAKQGGQ
jgi:hypothetical protein